jgi:site-specific recombinase
MLGLKDIRRLWARWQDSRDASQALDSLLVVPDVSASLADRNRWLIEVAYWLRRSEKKTSQKPSNSKAQVSIAEEGHPEHAKLRAFLKLLDQRPEAKLKISKLLRSILKENDALSLLCDTGVATKPSFWGEIVERIQNRLIAPPPNKPELAVLFSLGFVGEHDASWVHDLDADILQSLHHLVHYEEQVSEVSSLFNDMAESIHILISFIGASGLSYSVRSRLRDVSGQHSPFYKLGKLAEEILKNEPRLNEHVYQAHLRDFHEVINACYVACDDVYAHLDENGVSIETVFQVETMRLRLARVELLLNAWLYRDQAENYAKLAADLILTVQGHRSIRRLAEQSFALLSRKVVERSAEAGDHYIAGSRKEYFSMLKKSLGGGAIISGTVYLKFLIANLGLVRFFENILLAVNYAGSFLLIQFANFTLATKQPAMTAPALAQLLDGVHTKQGLEAFVDRAIALMRSQAASIFGNLAMVVPIVIAIQVGIILLLGSPTMSAVKAQAIFQSVSPFSAAFIFAAFTGVLLWLSSLIAGLVDNWFVLHRMQDVISYNRRINIVFGDIRAARWGQWWKNHISIVAANVSLGFLLIYGPTFLGFLGIGMEIRHITLSAGQFAAAATALGWKTFLMAGFWLGIVGVLLIGVLNVMISFSLAFNMALRSRDLPALDRRRLYSAVRARIKADFKSLLFPPK